MGSAVGSAAGAGLVECALGVRQAHQVHAVMQQRQHHRQQCRLLAAVQGLRGGEHCGRFAREHAGQPQAPRAVEEALQRCGHVAEARRAAEHQCLRLAQILEGGVRRPARRHRLGRTGAFGVHRRHGSQPRTGARNCLHAAAHVARELGGRAAARVVEHQYLRHAVLLRPRTGRGALAVRCHKTTLGSSAQGTRVRISSSIRCA